MGHLGRVTYSRLHRTASRRVFNTLQRKRLHNLPRQPVPVLRHPQREEEKMGKVQVYGVESIAGKKALLTENGSVKGS